jgi:hypothetical protein
MLTMAKFVIRYMLAAGIATGALYAAKPLPATVADKGPAATSSTQAQERTLKRKVAIARFTNETTYGRSFLVDKDANPIGKQALDSLSLTSFPQCRARRCVPLQMRGDVDW